MHLIYANAWATIIALTGNSAASGLPRVGFPGRSSQLGFTHGSIQLLSVMKTLKQQIESSIWSSRAWTFQEALLSPRCFYFTPDQVYFSCNMTQFCESIDESGSAFHRMTYDKTLESLRQGHYTELGQGIFRDPSCIPFERKRPSRWGIYSDLVCEYSHRHLTFDSDAYNAIRAALTALGKSLFPKGFFWGLPKEQLAAALVCWNHETMPHRRKDFPSWSCLGWKGPLRPIQEGVLNRGLRQFEPPFRAFACPNGDLELIYASYPNTADSTVKPRPPKWYRGRGSDPVVDLTFYGIKDFPKFDIDELPSNTMLPKLLFLECLVFQPKATSTTAPDIPESERKYRPEFSRVVLINGVPCIVTCDSQTTVEKILPDLEEYLFPKSHSLLLACRSSICQYHFMLIERVDASVDSINNTEQLKAKRVGTVSIHFQNLNGLDDYNWYQLPPTLGVPWWSNAADRMHRVFPPGSLQSRLVILE
jgi:Heterokaryon incompatibility protein (HET)